MGRLSRIRLHCISLWRSRWLHRGLVGLGLLGLGLAGWWVYALLTRPIDGAHVFSPFETTRLPLSRTAPDGTAYTVDPGRAIFALAMASEDAASRRVFPSYAAALRHAREQDLPTMPSVPLVLAAGRALETRLQMALERQLERGERGRPALLRRWLTAVQAQRASCTEVLRPACARAERHLTEAIALGEGAPGGDTALGPWGEDEDLRRVWRRDRHLADALTVDDEAGAGAAAMLARTLAADPQLAAGWAEQAAVARAWSGPPGGATCEELALALAGVADEALAAAVRAVVDARPRPARRRSVAPAALAWVMSPEEQILAPLGMAAWDDPIAALIGAIDGGRIDLAPAADAGFYRRRWHALETLAAPRLAPETLKLQLTADYLRRWRRAFAAGFSEGRSGLVKRTPEICAGSSGAGPVPVEVAPQFTAEPAPSVYLRLGRAYRALAGDLERALGGEVWQGLRDAAGAPLATAVSTRADLLFGLGASVCAELGYPLPRQPDEAGFDAAAAMRSAKQWADAAESDLDVAADARLLVTLSQDEAGRHRCPAIAGVRLEPVVYRWVEEPEVSFTVEAHFVPARYWLPSPCPLTMTVETVPAPAAFRARCDGHAEVGPLYAAFGQTAPVLCQAQRPWWPWLLAAAGALAAIILARAGWRRLPRPGRWRLALAGAGLLAGALAWLAWFPPYAVVRFAAVHVITATPNLAILASGVFGTWSADHGKRLFLDLISDPDPQLRYTACRVPIHVQATELGDSDLVVLRRASEDAVPEVGWYAWFLRCRSREETTTLVADLERTSDPLHLREHLLSLFDLRSGDAAVLAAALRLADTPVGERRTAVHRALLRWEDPPPAVVARMRTAVADPVPAIRVCAARMLGERGAATDIPALLALLQDGEATVRIAAFRALGQRLVDSKHPEAGTDRPDWDEPAIQAAVLRYVRDPAMTADERLSAGQRVTEPDTLRAVSRELLAVADVLPVTDQRYPRGDEYFRSRWSRNCAQAYLVFRWLTTSPGAAASAASTCENDGGLQEHPALLAPLLQAMRDDAGPETVLPVLERALADRAQAHTAIGLIGRLGPSAIPLADIVIAFHQRGGEGCEDWHALEALVAMGPAVKERVLPLLRAATRDQVHYWRIEDLLNQVEGGDPKAKPARPQMPGGPPPGFLAQ